VTTDVIVEIALDAAQVDAAAGVGRVVRAGGRMDPTACAALASLADRRVLVGPIDPCGECDVCRRGGAPVCPLARRRGPLGATVSAAARWLVPLDDGLDLPGPEAAAVAGDVATAYTLYARTGVGPREPVVVIGATAIGRFLIEILVAKGIAPAAVAATTPGDPWSDWLRGKGVAAAGDRAALVAVFAEHGLATRPWRVICADPAVTAAAAELAGPRATLTVLAGAPPQPLPGDLIAREVGVIAVAGPHPDLVVEAAAMCVKHEIDLAGGTTFEPEDPLRTHLRTFR
jgi:6-hydroxycyclohex-1-ene-1-carbonyl-CoA dehydrogenase